MADFKMYDHIDKYIVKATLTGPLHVGSAQGEKGEVLIHPVDDLPFIQATGLVGVMRNYYRMQYGTEAADDLFGHLRLDEGANASDHGSRIRVTDGFFIKGKDHKIRLELRPRVRINEHSGAVDSAVISGENVSSGLKFDMEYVGAGASFTFDIYLSCDTATGNLEEDRKRMRDIFTAMHTDGIRVGGQRSNGCGCIRIDELRFKSFDLRKKDDRRLWIREDALEAGDYENLTLSKEDDTTFDRGGYEVTVTGRTRSALLVKGLAVSDFGADAPDAEQIRNVNGDYIIPGSALKGTLRARMQLIARYLKDSRGFPAESAITNAFGKTGKGKEKGLTGNLCVYDSIVGTKEDNDKAKKQTRIHLDIFSGGVFYGGLFSERPVSGNVTMQMSVKCDKDHPEKSRITCALLLLALRDLAAGQMTIGSGQSIGRGVIDVDKIIIKDSGNQEAVVYFRDGRIEDPARIIGICLKELNALSAAGE